MAAVASASTAPPFAEMPTRTTPHPEMPPPVSSTSTSDPPPPHPLLPTACRGPRRRTREVSSRYLSTPLLTPATNRSHTPRASTASCLTVAPSPHAHHHPPATRCGGHADENHRPTSPVSRKRAAAGDVFDEMATPKHRLRPPTPFAAGVAGATSAPRRILRTSTASPIAASAVHRGSRARPLTPVRTSFCFYSPSSDETGAAMGEASSVRASCRNLKLVGPESSGSSRGRAPCSELQSLQPEGSGHASKLFCFRSDHQSSLPRTEGSGRTSNSFCLQSLNSALSDCQAALPKTSLLKPPQPPKAAAVKKKGAVVGDKKFARRQADVHQLRIMDNYYMQYRFLNAQAEAVAIANNAAAEKSLCGLSKRIAGLQESVAEKRAELECLKRVERVQSVAAAQVPALEQWSELDTQHSSCITRGAAALHDASSCLPVIGNVRIDIGEVTGALNSAMKILEQLSPCVEVLSQKVVQEVEDVTSNLAKVIGSEEMLLEECADLLHQAHNMEGKQLKDPPDAAETNPKENMTAVIL
ncbi:hypothetical protein ACP70R_024853 [Stipagrostis hirtigluma subsp. patula]